MINSRHTSIFFSVSILLLSIALALAGTSNVLAACIDADGDGYGKPGDASCPKGAETDCNDSNPNMYHGEKEGPYGDATCSDGIDNDCDNDTDSDDNACQALSCLGIPSPFGGPHWPLLNPDGTTHQDYRYLLCYKCHNPNDFLDDQRYQCQRCHADPADTSDPLNGVMKAQYPLPAPYGFGSAQNVKMHSSTVVGEKYGNWDMKCTVCHSPHGQVQDHRNDTTYGKYIKDDICFSNPVTGLNIENYVYFVSPSGAGSFADGAPYNQNICETCHTRTNHHRSNGLAPGDLLGNTYIGHNDGSRCVYCHPHSAGFKVGCGDQ